MIVLRDALLLSVLAGGLTLGTVHLAHRYGGQDDAARRAEPARTGSTGTPAPRKPPASPPGGGRQANAEPAKPPPASQATPAVPVTDATKPEAALAPASPQAPQPQAPQPVAQSREPAPEVVANASPPPAEMTRAVPEPAPDAPWTPTPHPELVAKADALFDNGDISGARLWLEAAMERGDAEAAFRLGETYDPSVLAGWKVIGIKSDVARARALYAKAAGGGVAEARARGEALPR